MVAVILGREFSVTVLRSIVHARGQALPASPLGQGQDGRAGGRDPDPDSRPGSPARLLSCSGRSRCGSRRLRRSSRRSTTRAGSTCSWAAAGRGRRRAARPRRPTRRTARSQPLRRAALNRSSARSARLERRLLLRVLARRNSLTQLARTSGSASAVSRPSSSASPRIEVHRVPLRVARVGLEDAAEPRQRAGVPADAEVEHARR